MVRPEGKDLKEGDWVVWFMCVGWVGLLLLSRLAQYSTVLFCSPLQYTVQYSSGLSPCCTVQHSTALGLH